MKKVCCGAQFTAVLLKDGSVYTCGVGKERMILYCHYVHRHACKLIMKCESGMRLACGLHKNISGHQYLSATLLV